MAGKLIGILDAIGRDIKKYFGVGVAIGETIITQFDPKLGPAFNIVANAVQTAEANAAVVGQSAKTGTQKAAAVTGIAGNLIAAALQAAGKPATATDIQNFIASVVTALNTAPAATQTPIAQA
jgi:hypothetical protein